MSCHELSKMFRFDIPVGSTKNRNGWHLFQGRYKAILVDADQYLLELLRYIHLNPLRAGMVKHADHYNWSSHQVYTGKRDISLVHTGWINAQFSECSETALALYLQYMVEPFEEGKHPEFHQGNRAGRILGDEHFAEMALRKAGEQIHQKLDLDRLVEVVCQVYQINEKQLIAKGKTRHASEARSVIAWFVRESENLTLEKWGERCGRDGVTLSNAIRLLLERKSKDKVLKKRMEEIKKNLISESVMS